MIHTAASNGITLVAERYGTKEIEGEKEAEAADEDGNEADEAD